MAKNGVAKTIAASAMLLALCLFSLVVGYGWARHALPNSGNVIVMGPVGMVVVGAVLGFALSVISNFVLRVGPSKLRLPLSGLAWVAVCWAGYAWLLNSGGDPARSAVLAAIAGVAGMIVGVPYAEILVGTWFVRRILAESEQRQADLRGELARKLEEIEPQSQTLRKAARDKSLEDQERARAIRNYIRS